MAVGSIEVTAGSGTHIWTDSRSVSSVTRHAQFVLPAQSTYATYSVLAEGISVATTADHILQIMADGTNYSRVIRYRITPTDDIPAAATVLDLQCRRISTAGTGGSAVTPTPYDAGDSSYGGGAMTLPTAKGTEGATFHRIRVPVPAAHPFASSWTWEAHRWSKPLVFGTGTGAGVAFKITTGVASCTVDIVAEILVTSFL